MHQQGKPNLVSSQILFLCLPNQLPLLENLVEVLFLSLSSSANETFLLMVSGAPVCHPERCVGERCCEGACVLRWAHTGHHPHTSHTGASRPLGAAGWKGL